MKRSGKALARSDGNSGAGPGIPGLLLVFFDAPDTQATRDWLFGPHALAVMETVPGVWRSRSFEVLNPTRPGEPRWLTILETTDVEATWRFRWLATGDRGKVAATKRGVTNRREYFVRLLNDKSRKQRAS